jgi:alkaline phosphatase
LFVEGSQIDWAAHENNVVGVISEMEDFTAAITVALDHAAAHPDTLVVVTADHETGGMSIGRDDVYRWDPRPMRGLEMTPAEMANGFVAGTGSLSAYLKPLLPFRLKREERQALDGVVREPDAVFNAICAVFDRRTVTGWTTHGHTAVDVPIYATGPGSERFRGTLQNEEVGRRLQELLLPEG